MKKLLLIILLSTLLINNAFAEKIQTNIKNIFWKNPSIGPFGASVTIVNNSLEDIGFVTISFFDMDGDQIKTCNERAIVFANSGDTIDMSFCDVFNIKDMIKEISVRVQKLKMGDDDLIMTPDGSYVKGSVYKKKKKDK